VCVYFPCTCTYVNIHTHTLWIDRFRLKSMCLLRMIGAQNRDIYILDMCVRAGVCSCACVRERERERERIFVCVYTHTQTHIGMYVCIYTHTYMYIHICTCMYIYTCVYTYMNTYIYSGSKTCVNHEPWSCEQSILWREVLFRAPLPLSPPLP
jgi:hypothetical protein